MYIYICLIDVFSSWSEHCKELKLKGNLSDCPQILTVGRLTYKPQKSVRELLISKYFFNGAIFV